MSALTCSCLKVWGVGVIRTRDPLHQWFIQRSLSPDHVSYVLVECWSYPRVIGIYPKNLKKGFSSFLVQRILCLNDLVIAYLKSPVPATAPLSARGERKWNFSLSPLQARLCSSLTRPTLAFFTTFLFKISVQTVLCHTAAPPGHCCGHRVSSVSWWHVPVSSPRDGLRVTPDSRHCVSVRCSRRARRPPCLARPGQL